jgi:hypothetical protein
VVRSPTGDTRGRGGGQGYEGGGDEGAYPRTGHVRETDGKGSGAKNRALPARRSRGTRRRWGITCTYYPSRRFSGWYIGSVLGRLFHTSRPVLWINILGPAVVGVWLTGDLWRWKAGAAPTLAHAAVQPPDLRRQRCLRPGDRRQKYPGEHTVPRCFGGWGAAGEELYGAVRPVWRSGPFHRPGYSARKRSWLWRIGASVHGGARWRDVLDGQTAPVFARVMAGYREGGRSRLS